MIDYAPSPQGRVGPHIWGILDPPLSISCHQWLSNEMTIFANIKDHKFFVSLVEDNYQIEIPLHKVNFSGSEFLYIYIL